MTVAAEEDEMAPAAADAQEVVNTAAELQAVTDAVDNLAAQSRLAEALPLAQRAVDLAEQQYGASLALIDPMNQLINLQVELGELADAEHNLSELIKLVEEQDNIFSFDLIEPLALLAEIYSRTGRREEAITILRRARHITHRRLGILNVEQIELAEDLAENYFELGRISEANRENRFAFRVNEREFGSDSAELVPALNSLARWYEQVGEHSVARRLYRRTIELIEQDYGENDLRLVEQLQRIAQTFRGQNLYKGEGKDALTRAVEIHEQNPQTDVIEKARTLAELGDWMMVTSQRKQAMRVYRQAWNLLTGDGANPEKGDIIFGKPKRLKYTPPIPEASLVFGRSEVYVDVEFLVTSNGMVTDLSIADASAHWRTQNNVRLAMRHARFRPKFKNGEPTDATMRYRWTYRVPKNQRSTPPAETPK